MYDLYAPPNLRVLPWPASAEYARKTSSAQTPEPTALPRWRRSRQQTDHRHGLGRQRQYRGPRNQARRRFSRLSASSPALCSSRICTKLRDSVASPALANNNGTAIPSPRMVAIMAWPIPAAINFGLLEPDSTILWKVIIIDR